MYKNNTGGDEKRERERESVCVKEKNKHAFILTL